MALPRADHGLDSRPVPALPGNVHLHEWNIKSTVNVAEAKILVLSPPCFRGVFPFLLILDHTQHPHRSQTQAREPGQTKDVGLQLFGKTGSKGRH